ncbi:hypothetical protein P3G55_15665 [Leptospira sp. 96542]|nr:hypothetical protein [Leptospira sp. 96542]
MSKENSIRTICSQYLGGESNELWKKILFELLPNRPQPLLCHENTILSAAAIWAYLKIWKDEFRKHANQSKKSIVISLEPSPEWVIVFLAALWENFSIFMIPPENINDQFPIQPWAIVSKNLEIANWTINSDLKPNAKKPLPINYQVFNEVRIAFYSDRKENKSVCKFTDQELAKMINKEISDKSMLDVKQNMNWNEPNGFIHNFLIPFVSSAEIFFPFRNK